MSSKLVKPKTPEELKKESRKNTIKKFFKAILIIFGLIITSLFIIYQYLHYTKGFTIYFQKYNIENQYARFLIEINDSFIENMISFDDTAKEGKSFEDYSDFDKEKLSNIIVAEGNLISRLENTPPSDKNIDYKELYDNILKSYALYIQGQTMKMEYIYQTVEGLGEERFTLGDSLTTLMGNFIIEYNTISNGIRNTTFDYKYSVADGFDIKTGDFEQQPVEYDEDGNLILDKDGNYLYVPEDVPTVEREESTEDFEEESLDIPDSDVSEDINDINNYINKYFSN